MKAANAAKDKRIFQERRSCQRTVNLYFTLFISQEASLVQHIGRERKRPDKIALTRIVGAEQYIDASKGKVPYLNVSKIGTGETFNHDLTLLQRKFIPFMLLLLCWILQKMSSGLSNFKVM